MIVVEVIVVNIAEYWHRLADGRTVLITLWPHWHPSGKRLSDAECTEFSEAYDSYRVRISVSPFDSPPMVDLERAP